MVRSTVSDWWRLNISMTLEKLDKNMTVDPALSRSFPLSIVTKDKISD